uniref:Ribosomal protein L6 n=1 Tax=Mallomonas splendens TaxID=52552 RepID=A0A3G2QZY8_9STRA|nr:ribosomal protein L6 [Mallomonas splendens]AYO28569.1 ribosomal protein L6 [Mallomonas splendens]
MSRIGKKPIVIPKDVSITLVNRELIVQGKFGTLKRIVSENINILLEPGKLIITRINEEKNSRESHGLNRALIQNMVDGVEKKFSKTLIAEGVGYRFQVEKNFLILNVGFTHPVQFQIPEDLSIKVESNTKIQLFGIDKEKVGFFAAKIRNMRPPEPYKGKGILYEGEKIIRKAGKTGK